MAEKKTDERTFTTEVSMRRDFVCGEYDFLPVGRRTVLASFCDALMHRRFAGLYRCFPKPKTGTASKRQQVEVTLRILPEEETK